MKKGMRLLAALLCVALLLGQIVGLALEERGLTRGEARDLILSYCDDYNAAAAADTLLRGYPDGSKGEGDPATRGAVLVMLSRAFDPLPAPDAYWGRSSTADVSFADVPRWAAADIKKLADAGLLIKAADGLLKPDETMGRAELERYLYRIFAAYGTNIKDDFYSTTNREELKQLRLLPGNSYASTAGNIVYETNQQLQQLVREVVAKESVPGTPEHLIKAYYTTWMENDAKPSDFASIRPWLEAIDGADSIAALDKICRDVVRETGLNPMYGFALGVNPQDSTQYQLRFWSNRSENGDEFYEEGTAAEQGYYLDYLTGWLEMAGYSDKQALASAKEFYQYETELSKVELSEEELYNPKLAYNSLTLEELQALLPEIDVKAELADDRLKPEVQVNVSDVASVTLLGKYMTSQKLESAKAILRVYMLLVFKDYMGADAYAHEQMYSSRRFGPQPDATQEERAIQKLSSDLNAILDKLYVEKYFSQQAKDDVSELTDELIEVYAQRIDQLDWMSSETKAMAKKKLDTMQINVGYPNVWRTVFDQTILETPEEGGTYFDNICAIWRAICGETSAQQGQPVNPDIWSRNTYEVNAHYDFTANSINFPAGILQAPYYDMNATRAENLGGIGVVIGHEISHAFDNSGAQYDENGNVRNWWTEQDYAEFERRCASVANYYDGWEVLPGAVTSGKLTLGENVADLAGVNCSLAVLKQTGNEPDYKSFFESYTRIWTSVYSPALAMQRCATDVHAQANLRVNRVLSTLDEFYEVYGITEEDAMFVPSEQRVAVW